MKLNYQHEGVKNFDNETLKEIDYVLNNYTANESLRGYLVQPGGKALKFDNIYKQMDVSSGSKMLEFGPGAGYAIYMGLKYGFDIWGIDIDQIEAFGIRSFDKIQKILNVQDRIKFYDGVNAFPFEDNEFDIFISNNALHHVKTLTCTWEVNDVRWTKDDIYKKRFEEISRVMKKNSKLYIKGKRAELAENYLNKIENPKKLKIMCYKHGEVVEYNGKETLNYFDEKDKKTKKSKKKK